MKDILLFIKLMVDNLKLKIFINKHCQLNSKKMVALAEIFNYGSYEIIKPLATYTVGIIIYAVFTWHFYRSLAKRDLFKIDLHKYNVAKHPLLKKTVSIIIYIFEYIIFFPLLTFIWFAFLAGFILLLSKVQTLEGALLVAMAIVAATRVTAYYAEGLSQDLAKIFPFALLAVFVIDPNFFTYSSFIEKIKTMPNIWKTLLNYILFTIVLEFIIRVPYSIYNLVIKEEVGEEESENEAPEKST